MEGASKKGPSDGIRDGNSDSGFPSSTIYHCVHSLDNVSASGAEGMHVVMHHDMLSPLFHNSVLDVQHLQQVASLEHWNRNQRPKLTHFWCKQPSVKSFDYAGLLLRADSAKSVEFRTPDNGATKEERLQLVRCATLDSRFLV